MTPPSMPTPVASRQTTERLAVVAEAYRWLGTPFHHAARLHGVGVDCANLLVACYEKAGITAPMLDDYPPDWFLHEGRDRFGPYLDRYCVPTDTPSAGDTVLFRYGRGVSHAGILVDHKLVIHAFRDLGVIFGSLEPTHELAPRLAGYFTLRRWIYGTMTGTAPAPRGAHEGRA